CFPSSSSTTSSGSTITTNSTKSIALMTGIKSGSCPRIAQRSWAFRRRSPADPAVRPALHLGAHAVSPADLFDGAGGEGWRRAGRPDELERLQASPRGCNAERRRSAGLLDDRTPKQQATGPAQLTDPNHL